MIASALMADELEITIASHPRWLRLLRHAVRDFVLEAGFGKRQTDAITLAVDEAVGNVIQHAYRGRTDHKLTVVLSAEGGGVAVRVRDHGRPFDPTSRPSPPPDELRAGGRGLFLIREIMDELEYGRENGANVFRMSKRLTEPGGETELSHGN